MIDSAALEERLLDHWGTISTEWRWLVEHRPAWTAAFCDYLDATRTGAIDRASYELLCVAAFASCTTQDPEWTRVHVANARRHGATEAQVVEVLQLVSMLGMHSVIDGLAPVLDEVRKAGWTPAPDTNDMRARYLDGHGYWKAFDRYFPGFHDDFIAASPELFETYQTMGAASWETSSLDGWLRELVFVVMDLSSTHLYISGAKYHTANALHYGATPEQALEALRLCTRVSSNIMALGIRALTETGQQGSETDAKGADDD